VTSDQLPAAVNGAAGGQARSPGRTATAIRDLDPGYFALVMATGIVSVGTFLLGPPWLSRALLVVTWAGLVVLGTALLIRLFLFGPSVAADFYAPDRVFGFFTITAGLDVLGVRLAAAGHPLITVILACVAAAVWLVLTYAVPAGLLLARSRDSVLSGINGTWLLWAVSTQSLSLAASTLVPAWPSQSSLLAPFAVGLWSVGLLLYVLVVCLILLRWRRGSMVRMPTELVLLGTAGARRCRCPAGPGSRPHWSWTAGSS
jgi:tellurite resistance protein TehA-like permease